MITVEKKRMEAMYEEMEYLRSIKLFSLEDSADIMKRRKEFEIKIHSATKELNFFLNYIDYEISVLKAIKTRKEKKSLIRSSRSVEMKIVRRVKALYEAALQKYSSDTAVLNKFLSFCRKYSYPQEGSDMVSNIYKKHFNIPEICQIAAKWCAYDEKNLKSAASKIMKTISYNKTSELLYHELIEIDLLKLNGTTSETEASVKKEIFNKFDTILTMVLKLIKNHAFFVEILERLENQEFTAKIQLKIINHLIKEYSDNEDVWHALAQREQRVKYDLPLNEENEIPSGANLSDACSVLSPVDNLPLNKNPMDDDNRNSSVSSGSKTHSIASNDDVMMIDITDENDSDFSDSVNSSSSKRRTPKVRLEACFSRYKEGLSKISPDNKPKLWFLYINFLFRLQDDALSGGTVLKFEALRNALSDASKEKCLSETHYLAWLGLEREENKLKIMEEATTVFPNCVELWVTRLHLQSLVGPSSAVDHVFKLGTTALKENALPLWKTILKYHYCMSDKDYVESIYKDGVQQPKEISASLKCLYIEWLVVNKGIASARNAYLQIADLEPYCKELHEAMSKIETMDVNPKYECGLKIHKFATEQFGHEDIDVWLNYIKYYLLYFFGKLPNSSDPNPMQEICKQAESKLPKYLFDDFIDEHEKLIAQAKIVP